MIASFAIWTPLACHLHNPAPTQKLYILYISQEVKAVKSQFVHVIESESEAPH